MIFEIKKINKKLFALFLLCLFLLPAISLAGLKLEQRYPDIPGLSPSINKTVEATAQKAPGVSIAALIKYLTGLVFVLSIGAATISLIVAGIQYLTNRGNKGNLKTAKTRIYKSAIGVAILVGSYLILQLISPSFQVPKLEKIYVSSQVVLFTQEGAVALEALNQINFTKDDIDELVSQGKARYFSSQWTDATEYLGDLTERNGSINFDFFPVVGIGLMGNGADNIKVLTFADKNFSGNEIRYSVNGVTDKNEKSLNIGPKKYESFTETLYYFNLGKTKSTVPYFKFNTVELTTGSIEHPPLSMAVVGIGPGVYLYGSSRPIPIGNQPTPPASIGGVDVPAYYRPTPPSFLGGTAPPKPEEVTPAVGGKNEQRYLQSNVSDFSDQGFDYDNMAVKIEIRNNNKVDKKTNKIIKENDLMAVLFNDADYKGGFRIFFEKRDVNIPLVYIDNALKGSWTGNARNLSDKNILDKMETATGVDYGKFKPDNEATDIGNIGVPDPKKDIGEIQDIVGVDMLGKVEGASSIKIFNLMEIANSDCEEVRLCNQADLGGYCLSFTPDGQRISGLYDALTLPMPWFAPASIPEYLLAKQDVDTENLGGVLDSNYRPPNQYVGDSSGNQLGELGDGDNKKFAGNIRSIGMDGKNCAVALFENAVKNPEKCFDTTNADPKQCWNNGGPGEKSQMFSYNDMIQPKGNQISYLNLSDQPIGSCTKREWLIKLKVVPCASAIAVFPVK